MKSQMGWLSLVSVAVALLSSTPSFGAEENVKWREKMHALAKTMSELLPELFSKKGDPAIIEKDAKTLSELSHSLKPGLMTGKMVPPEDADPSLQIIATRFSDETKSAYRAIHAGNLEYGKNRLKTITSYCISCHTRHDKGPNFPVFPLDPKTEQLGPEEKAALFVATRQFDKGLEAFEALIKDNDFAKKRPFEWEQAVRSALAISIKVKNDPVSAKQIVDLALKSPTLPDYSRSYLTKWQRAIETWKKEGPPQATGDIALLNQVRNLMSEAKQAQLFPIDHCSDVQFLRASAVAHDLLRQEKNPKVRAEGLLAIGNVTEVMGNYLMWPLQDSYYEACIREVPHSTLAQQCYEQYEQSVYMGFTGSAGTFIPDDTQEVLSELKALAKPKGK